MANPALYNRFCTRWGGPPSGVCCLKKHINIIYIILFNILHKLNSSPRYYKYSFFSVKLGFIFISWINYRKITSDIPHLFSSWSTSSWSAPGIHNGVRQMLGDTGDTAGRFVGKFMKNQSLGWGEDGKVRIFFSLVLQMPIKRLHLGLLLKQKNNLLAGSWTNNWSSG